MDIKAQTEIMGLVVIVLLLSIGILFVVVFFIQAEEESPQQAFTEEQTPLNMIHAILETDTGCKRTKMRDLFKDCYAFERIRCGEKTSCEFLYERLQYIFNETLDKWRIPYEFNIGPREDLKFPSFGKCRGERTGTPQPLKTDLGDMYINLAICGKI